MSQNNTPSPESSGSHPTPPRTNRIRACLHCRRRKMKCDGARPACAQCVRSSRGSECVYDDGESKTQYQLLYEKLHKLETRLKELQGPKRQSQLRGGKTSVFHVTGPSGMQMMPPKQIRSSIGKDPTAGSSSLSATFTVELDSLQSDPFGSYGLLERADLLNCVGLSSVAAEPPLALSKFFLESFIPHAQQCGLTVNPQRFISSMTAVNTSYQLGVASYPHPALKNAVWLWGCHFCGDKNLIKQKSTFLRRARDGLDDLLQRSEGLLEAIQASCLVATYLFAHNRMVEGVYYANAAALLASSAGLHRHLPPGSVPSPTLGPESGPLALPPPMDGIQWAERLLAFWNVYVLERSWSAATAFPSQRWEDREFRDCITSPWPYDMDCYNMGFLPPDPEFLPFNGDPRAASTVYNFFAGCEPMHPTSKNELRCKAAALFDVATRYGQTAGDNIAQQSQDERLKIETAILSFCRRLPHLIPYGQRGSNYLECMHFTTHALAHAAIIRFHQGSMSESSTARSRCCAACDAMANAIGYLVPGDYQYLEPIMASCWMLSALLLSKYIKRMRSLSLGHETGPAQIALETITNALRELGNIFPVAVTQYNKLISMSA